MEMLFYMSKCDLRLKSSVYLLLEVGALGITILCLAEEDILELGMLRTDISLLTVPVVDSLVAFPLTRSLLTEGLIVVVDWLLPLGNRGVSMLPRKRGRGSLDFGGIFTTTLHPAGSVTSVSGGLITPAVT
jgi:hypothetical protein